MSKKENIPLFVSPTKIKENKSIKKKQPPSEIFESEQEDTEEEWDEEEGSQVIDFNQLINNQQKTLEDRGIFIFQKEVNSVSVEKIMRKMLELHFDENFADPIQIMLNSPGGLVSSGFALIDLMRFIKNPVRTIAMGEIASMGTMIFIAGDERIITSNTSVMIH